MTPEKNYGEIDFLTDERFIRWRLFRDPDTEAYWRAYAESHPDAREALESAVRIFSAVRINDRHMTVGQSALLWERIAADARRRRFRRFTVRYAAAACIAFAVVSGLLFFPHDAKERLSAGTGITGVVLEQDEIRLVSNGGVEVFGNNACIDLTATKAVPAGGQPVAPDHAESRLVVPYGKRAHVVLADGSKVWVNAGSELVFPSAFGDGRRMMEVVRGEIFIDVTKDPHRPFTVRTPEFEVEVLGTSFDVSVYPGAGNRHVALVEGLVLVRNGTQMHKLSPGELFCADAAGATVSRPDNLQEYCSWKDGILVLDGTTVSEILTRIGRYYNIAFSYGDSRLASRTCSGKLILSDNLDDMLSVLCSISGTTFRKSGGKVFINDSTFRHTGDRRPDPE